MPITKAKPKIRKSAKKVSVAAFGFDLSPSCLAGSMKLWDAPLGKMKGPACYARRWPKGTEHFEKLRELSEGHEFVHILQHELLSVVESSHIYIGIEDLPPKLHSSQRFREQAELIGAFIGGLLRWGYPHVQLVNARSWQALVANDMDMKANKDFNKWHVKNWARETYDLPKWKDLVRNGKLGLIPKPKGSKAMPEQPDDRYDAVGIMEYVCEQIPGKVLPW